MGDHSDLKEGQLFKETTCIYGEQSNPTLRINLYTSESDLFLLEYSPIEKEDDSVQLSVFSLNIPIHL